MEAVVLFIPRRSLELPIESPVQALHTPNLTPHNLTDRHYSLAAPPGTLGSVRDSAQGTLQISQVELGLRPFSPVGAGKAGAEGPPSFLDKLPVPLPTPLTHPSSYLQFLTFSTLGSSQWGCNH